jgi:hypothetical protein
MTVRNKVFAVLTGLLTLCCLAVTTASAATVGVSPSTDVPHAQPCNDHMQAPWLALYKDTYFGGESICFLGGGYIDLGLHPGWAEQVSSVNSGAEGVFDESPWTGSGQRLPFHYGTRYLDLTSNGWNDRITSFEIHG